MRTRYVLLMLYLIAALSGCGGQEYAYVDGRDAKQGPGLLSGEDGAFTLYGKDRSSSGAPHVSESARDEE